MRNTSAPKFLYHGTSVLSVWASYHKWKKFGKVLRKHPQQAEFYLDQYGARDYFNRFGPYYPDLKKNAQHVSPLSLPCLTRDLYTALDFADSWKVEGYNTHDLTLALKSDKTRVHFNTTLEVLGIKPVRRIAQAFKGAKADIRTPGAILIFDGRYLESAGLLLPPMGEEDYVVRCLPWGAMRGIFLVDAKGQKISGFMFEDRRTLYEVMEELASFHYFEVAQKCFEEGLLGRLINYALYIPSMQEGVIPASHLGLPRPLAF